MQPQPHDVLIIGGGISGSALLFLLARYTDLKSIGLVEKCSHVAALNSHGRNNSQTLHCGDIETNYSLDKAIKVKAGAAMTANYALKSPRRDQLIYKYPKMVLGVGEQECEFLQKRFEAFKPHFPQMLCMEKDGLARVEPNLVKARTERIVGLVTEDHYDTVNFQAVADSFIRDATAVPGKTISTYLNTRVTRIEQHDKLFWVETDHGPLQARFVVVSSGGHSLLFAQRMGYGKEYACLPVAGSFYFSPPVLNGKVYTIQKEKLPFAAVHGDPDILVPGKTRFGPTALILPMLERYNWGTVLEFFETFSLGKGVRGVMWDLFKDSEIRAYMLRNILFEVPIVRERLFVSDVQKIVPSIKASDLRFAQRVGGVRPVMIDKLNRKLHLGEAKINPGAGIIFNMTPSPGATSCLQNGEQDMRSIAAYLGCQINETMLANELKTD
ncbi:MAG: FAD-dependent oxidoreductase [Gammaproteobacteria bacterium]|nr:FAD-dependent oxidoreductase [Gammaproteobacteria bacterium]